MNLLIEISQLIKRTVSIRKKISHHEVKSPSSAVKQNVLVDASSLTWTCLPAKSSDEHLSVTEETCFISMGHILRGAARLRSNKRNATDTSDNGTAGVIHLSTCLTRYTRFSRPCRFKSWPSGL